MKQETSNEQQIVSTTGPTSSNQSSPVKSSVNQVSSKVVPVNTLTTTTSSSSIKSVERDKTSAAEGEYDEEDDDKDLNGNALFLFLNYFNLI